MSVLKFARNAAIAAAALALPAHAIAATPTTVPAAFNNIARAGASLDEANDQFSAWNDFLVPAVIIIAIGIGVFLLTDEDDNQNLQTSP